MENLSNGQINKCLDYILELIKESEIEKNDPNFEYEINQKDDCFLLKYRKSELTYRYNDMGDGDLIIERGALKIPFELFVIDENSDPADGLMYEVDAEEKVYSHIEAIITTERNLYEFI